VLFYMALIFILSSISPPPELAPGVPVPDKLLHGVLYAGLGALLVRALTGGWSRAVTLRIAVFAVAIAGFYGVTDEVHQSFVPQREADVLDVLADLLGAACASAGLFAWGIIHPNPRQTHRDLP
jgi:VanZ family protein